MTVKTNKKNSLASTLTNDAKLIINLRIKEPLGLLNSAIVTLFWEIGILINNYLPEEDFTKSPILNEVSDNLRNNYGSFFEVDNLIIMHGFASSCEEKTIKKISPYISWKYISSMIILSSYEEWIFYTRLTVQEPLTPGELSDKIIAKLFDKSQPFFLKYPDFPFFDLTAQNNKPKILPIDNFFKMPLLEKFEPFFKPKLEEPINTFTDLNEKSVLLLEKIKEKIHKIQNVYNSHFTLRFNLSLLEIGHAIKAALADSKIDDHSALIHNLSSELTKTYKFPFSNEALISYVEFAYLYSNQEKGINISALLRWEYILVLLPIENEEERMFYAAITVNLKLSVQDLEEFVIHGVYEQVLAYETDVKYDLQIATQSLSITKKGNGAFLINEIVVDPNTQAKSSFLVEDIFMNNLFLKFVTSADAI